MEPQDITSDLILAKKAAIDSGKFLLSEKAKINQRTNSDSKDIKLRADVESEEIIRDQLLRKNDDPELWLLLSEIQRNSQNILGYHQSRAEYYLLLGQDEQALNQLEFALKMTQNNFQASERIMTKIVDIKKDLGESRGL